MWTNYDTIELLLQGILTPQLVSKVTLRTTLLRIKFETQRHSPGSHLIFERATDFYAMRNFRFGRHDNHLLILLRVPITLFAYQFQIFKMTSFPVYVTGQISHTTSAQNLLTYFAINHNHAQYFTLDDDDTTDPRLLHIVNKQIALHDLERGASCISALFSNDVGQIHQLCTFTLSKQPLNPTLLLLRNGDVLTTNLSHLSLQCNDTRRQIPDCVQTLMHTHPALPLFSNANRAQFITFSVVVAASRLPLSPLR